MRYQDVVEFKDDLFFNGSVEIDCIYDNPKYAKKAAESYVFHSKKSFTKTDDGKVDSITFIRTLFDIMYEDEQNNPFITAIAGYGSGKSHLCTALASIFANNSLFLKSDKIIDNLNVFDPVLVDNLKTNLNKPNLIFAFNGMNDFDLTLEMHRQLKKYLQVSGIDITLFTEIDEVYDRAKKFVEALFTTDKFQTVLKSKLQNQELCNLDVSKKALIEKIKDDKVFQLVNLISEEITGNKYIIENYLNPRYIIEEVTNKLCGESKPFGKVLIIFDEIGRYIEWIGTKRTIDPSIMQQLYEGVKNSNGDAYFLSFIQFPLSTYFSHLAPGSYASIARYIDRYKTARIYHLSTVLETVFANLIKIKNGSIFHDYTDCQNKILSWQSELNNSFVWSDKDYYRKLICNKLAAFHPLTISLLAKLSEFTQKRGPLMILRELLDKCKRDEISAVPAIFPIALFDTFFLTDVKKMEEDGLLKTDYVSIYEGLVSKPKISRHLAAQDKAFLQALVVINLLDLKPISISDYYHLLEHITGIKSSKLKKIATTLEVELGVVQYDEDIFIHHIEIDAVGLKDFERFLITKRNEIEFEYDYSDPDFFTQRLKLTLSNDLADFKTVFYREITTLEWKFSQEIIDIHCNLANEIGTLVTKAKQAIMPEHSKGSMVWIYINSKYATNAEEEMERVQRLSDIYKIEKIPIQIGFILDNNLDLYRSVIEYDAVSNMNTAEKEKYASFFKSKIISAENKIKSFFVGFRRDAYYLIDGTTNKSSSNFRKIIDDKLKTIYFRAMPFKFDGFTKVKNHNARSEHRQILKAFSTGSVSTEKFNNYLKPQAFNRLMGLFGDYSWGIFEDGQIRKPKNEMVRIAFDMLTDEFDKVTEQDEVKIDIIFYKLLYAPYGMNLYSACLLLAVCLHFYRDRLTFNYDNKTYDYKSWVKLLTESNEIDQNLFKTTSVIQCDPEKLKKSIITLLQKLIDSTAIDEIVSLSKSIEDYGNKYDYDENIYAKIEQVKNKIFSANQISEAHGLLLKKIQNIESFITNTSDGVPNVLKEFIELKNDWKELQELTIKTTLEVPTNWEDAFNDISGKIISYISIHFEEWFSHNCWPTNHNVEGFNSFCKKIAKSLYILKLNNLGKSVNDVIKRTSEFYEYLNTCTQRIADYQNNIIPRDYDDCCEYEKYLKDFVSEIKSSDILFEKQKQEFVKLLLVVQKKIKDKKVVINNELSEIYSIVSEYEFKDIQELAALSDRLNILLNTISNTHIDYKFVAELYENAANLIAAYNKALANDYNSKEEIQHEVEKIKKMFSDNMEHDPDYIYCPKIFKELEKGLNDVIISKIDRWIASIQIPLNTNLDSLAKINPERLKQVFDYLSKPPKYLREADFNKLSKFKAKIESILFKSAEESIINLFKSIGKIEKQKEVIKKLEECMNV